MASLRPLWLSVGRLSERLRSSDGFFLGLDFDGTLTPVTDDPRAVSLPARARDVLEQLARREGACLAFLSSRTLDDLRERVGLGGVYYAGSSGLETLDERGRREVHAGPDPALPAALVGELERWSARFPGAWLERRPASCALHFKAVAPALQPALGAGVRRRVRPHLSQVALVHDRAQFEVMPAAGWNKAAALGRWLEGAPARALLFYFGDDTRDEPVHALVRARHGTSVAVSRIVSQAEYQLPTPEDVIWFLEWLDREWSTRTIAARVPAGGQPLPLAGMAESPTGRGSA